MPTYSDTATDLIINRLTKTQFDGATGLDPTQEYHVDPEFTGNKILSTDANGDIVETAVTNTELGYLSGTTSSVQTQLNGKQDVLTFDTTPTQNSTNPVTSGGIYNKIFSNDVLHKDTNTTTSGFDLLNQGVNTIHSLEGTGAINSPQGDSTAYNAGLSVKFGRDDNLEAWFRGFYLYGQWNNSNGLWYGTRAGGSSGTPATTINWHPVVIADKNNTFTGTNTFTNGLNFNKNGSIINYFKLTDVVRGTAPSAERSVIGFVVDSNGNSMYDINFKYLTTGRMYWVQSVNNGTKSVAMRMGIDENNNIYTEVPTPAVTGTGKDFINCQWFNNKVKVVSTVPVSPTTGVYYFVTTGQIYYGSTLVMDANLTNYTGYDATKTQTFKNVNGTLTWVDD